MSLSRRAKQIVQYGHGSLNKAVACKSNITALWWEYALFDLGYGCSPPAAPSDFDGLISGYRLGYRVTGIPPLYRNAA